MTERSKRTKITPPIELADSRDYHTFPKDDFKRGMIFRAPLHEEDYNAAAYSTPSHLSVAASDMSTAAGSAKTHKHITPWGTIYSDVRYMVVVVKGADTYIALPFFTHAGNGIAHKEEKDEYVSVQDHREPSKCVLQGEVDMVRTLELKHHVKILHEFTTVHLGTSVSRKYRLPIKHQGRLTDKDTDRLVSLFKAWITEH